MSGFQGLSLTPLVSRIVEGRPGTGGRLRLRRPPLQTDDQVACLLNLPLLRLFQNHTIDIGLGELVLLLLARRTALSPGRNAQMGSRKRFADPTFASGGPSEEARRPIRGKTLAPAIDVAVTAIEFGPDLRPGQSLCQHQDQARVSRRLCRTAPTGSPLQFNVSVSVSFITSATACNYLPI